jgi:hypothetical protein
VDGVPAGSRKRGLEEGSESGSPKKACTTPAPVVNPVVPLIDQDGHAAYKVTGEQWTTESGAPEVREEVSVRGQNQGVEQDSEGVQGELGVS